MSQFADFKKLKRREINKILKDSMNFQDLIFRLGYKATSGSLYHQIKKFLKDNNYKFKKLSNKIKLAIDLNNIFIKNSFASRNLVKSIILKDNLLPNKCSECSLEPYWNNKKLSLVLDHINGINNDHRLINLRLLCPNCNAQQITFAASNIKNLKKHKRILKSEAFKAQQESYKNQNFIAPKKVRRVYFSKQELLSVIKSSNSLAEASRKLKMSDNGLGKIYRRYNIDYRKILLENKLKKDEELRKKIIKAYKKFKSIKKTCQYVNIGRRTAEPFLKDIKIKRNKITPKIIKEIKKLSKKGYNNSDISRKVGFSRHTVDFYKDYKIK